MSVDFPAPETPVNAMHSPARDRGRPRRCKTGSAKPSRAWMVNVLSTRSTLRCARRRTPIRRHLSSATIRSTAIPFERRSISTTWPSYPQDRADEQLGVGVLRVVEHLISKPGLDDAAMRRMTTMRCASKRATARSCVTMITERPNSATSPRINPKAAPAPKRRGRRLARP